MGKEGEDKKERKEKGSRKKEEGVASEFISGPCLVGPVTAADCWSMTVVRWHSSGQGHRVQIPVL